MPRSVVDFDLRGGRTKEANLPDQNAQRLEQTAHALMTKSGWGEDPPSNVSISFNNGSLTFTITPSGSTFEYWIQGVKYKKSSAETVVITDTEGLWYIFYSGNTLTASQTPWNNGDGSVAFVALIHWDAANNVAIVVGWELHPYDMGVNTHKTLHNILGTQYEKGLGLVEGTGGDDGKVALDGGTIWDESIEITIVDGAGSGLWEQELGNTSSFAAAQIPVYYRSGATDWRKYSAGDYPFYDNSGGDNVHYNKLNGTWASTEAASSAKYVAMWIFGTNNIAEPVIAIMGQIESNTLNAAKDANTLETLDFGTLPLSEMKILYRLIFKSDSSHAHTEDMRSVSNVPGGTYVPLIHHDSDAIHDNIDGEINAINVKGTPVDADVIVIEDSAASFAKKKATVGSLPGSGGEANTMSSEGAGVSVYWQKDGINLELNAIKSENDRINVSLDGSSHDIELTLTESNIVHNNLAGIDDGDINHLSDAQVGELHSTYTNAEAVQAVEDAGIVLSNHKYIRINGDPDNGVYTGITLYINTDGCNVGQAVYIDGSNSVLPARGNSVNTMPAIGVVVSTNIVLTHGVYRHDSQLSALGTAVPVYVSEDTAGVMKTAVPGSAGDVVQIIGHTINQYEIFVNPSLDWVVRK